MNIPRIMVTMGDPCGIGPELCAALLADASGLAELGTDLAVVGSANVLQRAARRLHIPEAVVGNGTPAAESGRARVIDLRVCDDSLACCGRPTAAGGRASVQYIERAVSELMAGRADAVVTRPINKQALQAGGCTDPGHTEMIGRLTGSTTEPVMMMLNEPLHVAFVTTHEAIARLPHVLTVDRVVHTARVLAAALHRFFVPEPGAIALCAFNPHAGDGGRFGDEEDRILRPAVTQLRSQGLAIEGPIPADSLFYKAMQGAYNGVVALYHDQGMIPVKMHGPGNTVNVTIGLPVIRTSPAHGTAYDIAGQGRADPASFRRAIRTAVAMVKKSRR